VAVTTTSLALISGLTPDGDSAALKSSVCTSFLFVSTQYTTAGISSCGSMMMVSMHETALIQVSKYMI
jgi:hypothetical protein